MKRTFDKTSLEVVNAFVRVMDEFSIKEPWKTLR